MCVRKKYPKSHRSPARIVAITPLRGCELNPVSGRLSNAGSVYAAACRNNFSKRRERRKRDLSNVLQSRGRSGAAEKERCRKRASTRGTAPGPRPAKPQGACDSRANEIPEGSCDRRLVPAALAARTPGLGKWPALRKRDKRGRMSQALVKHFRSLTPSRYNVQCCFETLPRDIAHVRGRSAVAGPPRTFASIPLIFRAH